jgi:hypothetical protein
MPYYNLTNGEKVLSTPAGSRLEAISNFSKEIGKNLTLNDQGCAPEHLMSEREESLAWIKPGDIPVWVLPNA